MRSAAEVIEAIHNARYTGRKVGLENTRALLQTLELSAVVPAVHVAGTNGKGSVCAMVESMLRRAGYHTGLYTSPFLQSYHERIRLDGQPVSDELLADCGNQLLDAAARLRTQGIEPTAFELGTALALMIFRRAQVDVMVMEVGLGGRLDPTNIITPLVSAITAIGLDHVQLLGGTLPQIAAEKAGIIKPQVPVVCHPASAEVAQVFQQTAVRVGAPLHQLKASQVTDARCDAGGGDAVFHLADGSHPLRVALAGEYQLLNALTALEIIACLRQQGWNIPAAAQAEGLRTVCWPARLEWCGQVLLDGAHNPQGLSALRTYVETFLPARRRVLLTGVLEDHLQENTAALLMSLGDAAVAITPDSPRAMPADALAKLLQAEGKPVRTAPTLREGLRLAQEWAGSQGIVIVAGSLYLAGAARTELGLLWR